MEIKFYPERIAQGGILTVHADPYEPDVYNYNWEYPNIDPGLVSVGDSEAERRIDTKGLQQGAYKVKVTFTPPGATTKAQREKAIRENQGGTVENYFTVDPAPISSQEVEGFIDRLSGSLPREVRMGNAPPEIIDDRQDGRPGIIQVNLRPRIPAGSEDDLNLAFWQTIRNRTDAISFDPYQEFIDRVMCPPDAEEDYDHDNSHPDRPQRERLRRQRRLTISELHGVDAYNLLRAATETFLVLHAGVFVRPRLDPTTGRPGSPNGNVPGEFSRVENPPTFSELEARLKNYLGLGERLPYLDRSLRTLDLKTDGYSNCVVNDGFRSPLLLELIWSYWHEEGMLVQAIQSISMRFQNRRGLGERDPLANLATEPLRPLNNLLWGYIQDEIRRLSVQRRAYEYANEYGLTLYGKAVPEMQVADNRSKFIEAFHNLLYMSTVFYKQADDTTINPDPFPLLNALREVHIILAEGAHNQFGDLPWTARVEMLIQQWLMARPETQDFLRGRHMVPYEEPWMGPVETMKTLQGWSDTSISHFHRLARFGEQLLLSVRYTDWSDLNQVAENARTWSLYWRPEIQSYIHSYRAATGVDLAAEAAANQPVELRYQRPSELLRQRLEAGRNGRNGRVPSPPPAVPAPAGFRERKAQRSK
jgi:hypothetical protein